MSGLGYLVARAVGSTADLLGTAKAELPAPARERLVEEARMNAAAAEQLHDDVSEVGGWLAWPTVAVVARKLGAPLPIVAPGVLGAMAMRALYARLRGPR